MLEEEKVITEPEQKVYDEKQWKGLLGSKQEAIQRARSAEAKLAAIETQYDSKIKELEAQINAKTEDLDLGDPEDVPTNAKLKKIITDLKSELGELKSQFKKAIDTYSKEQTSKKEEQATKSLEKARKKYSEDNMGKGLAFDDVLEGTRRMIAKNKMYEAAIANDPDPGELIYRIGLMDETIAKRYETYQGSFSGGITPKSTLSGGTKPAGFLPQKYVQEMAKKDPGYIKAHLKEIHESQKFWSKDDR